MLDNLPTLNESDSPKKRKKKFEQDASLVKQIEIGRECSLDVQFRVISGIDGIYLNEENCPKMEMLE